MCECTSSKGRPRVARKTEVEPPKSRQRRVKKHGTLPLVPQKLNILSLELVGCHVVSFIATARDGPWSSKHQSSKHKSGILCVQQAIFQENACCKLVSIESQTRAIGITKHVPKKRALLASLAIIGYLYLICFSILAYLGPIFYAKNVHRITLSARVLIVLNSSCCSRKEKHGQK